MELQKRLVKILLVYLNVHISNIFQIIAFMVGNATNNDTFVDRIKKHAHAIGAAFNAEWAHLQCMPHTIHLAAIKVSLLLAP